MAIPEAKLSTWSKQGSVAGSSAAYESVDEAIGTSGLKQAHSIDVFLQGSYRNHTNIVKESDVDVVVNCHDSFFSDKSLLEGLELAMAKAVQAASYGWGEFRGDVRDALVDYYGASRVKDKSKCLQVTDAGGTGISADVVPAFDYRYYYQNAQTWMQGIAFLRSGTFQLIAGFPKSHYDNGVKKNAATNKEFKPTVRVFKNAAGAMVDQVLIYDGNAPPYFIECLIYNVPNEQFFETTWEDQIVGIYNWLEAADLSQFVCVNGVYRLFEPGQWTMDMADRFIAQFAYLWNNW